MPLPCVSPSAAETLFRNRVVSLLQHGGVPDEDSRRLFPSRHQPGVPVHTPLTVPAGDGGGLVARARCFLLLPVSLARLRWRPGAPTATHLPRDGRDDEKASARRGSPSSRTGPGKRPAWSETLAIRPSPPRSG